MAGELRESKGLVDIPGMKYRNCPFCRRQIAARAQKCRHCDGGIDAVTLKGNDWRNDPASDGQLAFLKKLKIKPPDGLNKGVVADLIEDARETHADLFQSATVVGKLPRKKSSALAVFVLLLILAGGAAGALHHFGIIDLKDLYAQARTFIEAKIEEREQQVLDESGSSDEPATELVAEEADESPASPVVAEEAPTPRAPRAKTLEDLFRARFKPPRTGSKIKLALQNRKTYEGILQGIDSTGVTLNTGKISMKLQRKQLSARSRAMCYEEEFASYMAARQRKVIEEQKKQQRQAAAKKTTPNKSLSSSTAKRTSSSKKRPASGSMSQEMEQSGQTDRLKALQDRVRTHESGAAKSGVAY
jgi:hypothetical protein